MGLGQNFRICARRYLDGPEYLGMEPGRWHDRIKHWLGDSVQGRPDSRSLICDFGPFYNMGLSLVGLIGLINLIKFINSLLLY